MPRRRTTEARKDAASAPAQSAIPGTERASAAAGHALTGLPNRALPHDPLALAPGPQDGLAAFDAARRARAVQPLSIEGELRSALEHEELELIYQPIVSLERGTLVAVEALLRWRHPARGLVGPGSFVSIAEDSGLIESIGRWVLERACAQAARWQARHRERPPLRICVNVSIQQLRGRELEATVLGTLAASGLEPANLCLELTEPVLLDGLHGATETMTQLAGHGVRFALDDFGTGCCSPAELARLPIDAVKIDRSLVAALDGGGRGRAVTTAIVRMAHALSLEVTAEGVESDVEVQELQALRCALAQGFHFHRPLAAAGISKLLEGERDREALLD
ncbi:MAG: EAL domain-containing protein [Solirubrobacteraceae bacterium]